jgi:hypothetical protein
MGLLPDLHETFLRGQSCGGIGGAEWNQSGLQGDRRLLGQQMLGNIMTTTFMVAKGVLVKPTGFILLSHLKVVSRLPFIVKPLGDLKLSVGLFFAQTAKFRL